MNQSHFALVGCGDIAESELEAIKKTGKAEVVLVMDSNEVYARSFGETHGIPFTSHFDDVLASSVDTVVMALPHHLHHPMALSAARAGKNIILEKPLATTLSDGLEIIETCRKERVLLSVAYIYRYREIHQIAKQIIKEGALGDLFRIQVSDCYTKPASYWTGGYNQIVKTDWRTNREKSGGGVWMMNMGHTIDYLLDITGLQVNSVYALAENRNTPCSEVEDDASVVLQLSGRVAASINASTIALGNPLSSEFICGTQGTLMLKPEAKLFLSRPWRDYPADEWISVHTEEHDPHQDPRDRYFRDYIEAVMDDKEVPIPGEEAWKILRIIRATYESAESGNIIRL
jgi:predicted dehydrogenase